MNKYLNKEKIFLIINILIIITGIIILCTMGFNKSIEYRAGTRIEVYIPQSYEKQDITDIVYESFSDTDFLIEDIEKLNQVAGIRISSYTEEELNNLKTNISEKYEIEEDKLEIYEIKLPTTRISTVIKPYIFPVVLVTVLSLIYVLFRNLKSENKWKKLLNILLTILSILGVYFSLILILRLPFGTFTMPLALTIYITTLIILVSNIKKNK